MGFLVVLDGGFVFLHGGVHDPNVVDGAVGPVIVSAGQRELVAFLERLNGVDVMRLYVRADA